MRYKFNMEECEKASSANSHKDYFRRYGVDWTTALWTMVTTNWNDEMGTFTSIDGKCEATTRISFFRPVIVGVVDLKKYM